MSTSMTSGTARQLSQADDARHFLRRLTFAATPNAVRAVQDRTVGDAFDALAREARTAPSPVTPEAARGVWANTAIRFRDSNGQQYWVGRAEQYDKHVRENEGLRHWWLAEMIAGPAPLRENLMLFLQGTLGSSSSSPEVPHALHGTNALLRRACFGTVPDLLEQLVADPGTMLYIGMDEYRREKLAQENVRPARTILDNWTVGLGEYADGDVKELARAFFGWTLQAPPGGEPSRQVEPKTDFRTERLTGLVPTLEREQVDAGPKTILGKTDAFDARSAVRFLALHPATARRYSRRLIEYFGVADADQALERQLVETYRQTEGSLEALVKALVASDQFWSPASRWSLIKSPVHLAVGACRQLELPNPPIPEISRWLVVAGQRLFDTPGWPGQRAWVTPPDRLAVRYQLGSVLTGRAPQLRIGVSPTAGSTVARRFALGRGLDTASARTLPMRLDPAPGLDPADVERRASQVPRSARTEDVVRQIVGTPQYQMA